MIRSIMLAAGLLCALFSMPAEARHRHQHQASVHPDAMCGVLWLCQAATRHQIIRGIERISESAAARIVSHPVGCPARAFCGCGASVRVFGRSIRSLWLAAAWFKFPRATPAVGMVAVRRGHVFVLESHINNSTWLAYDANSGHHLTRIHPRSIAGYTIVNPARAG
jgi:hypothetical protein